MFLLCQLFSHEVSLGKRILHSIIHQCFIVCEIKTHLELTLVIDLQIRFGIMVILNFTFDSAILLYSKPFSPFVFV